MQVSSALKIDPQLQTLTPRPSKRKEVKPRGLTQKSYTVPFSTRISPSLSPTTCFGNCNIYLASCPWFPRNEEQRRHAWQKSGMGADWRREGGEKIYKNKKIPQDPAHSTFRKHRWLFSVGMHGPKRSPASRGSPRPASLAPGGPRGRRRRRRAGGDGEGRAAFPHRQLPRLAGLSSDYP